MLFFAIFSWLLFVVACVKVIQVTGDIRAWRAAADSSVKPSMSTPGIVALVAGVSLLATVVIVYLVVAFLGGFANSLSNLGSYFSASL